MREYRVLVFVLSILMPLFIKKVDSLYNPIKFLVILYPKSLANLVFDVGTRHIHQIVLTSNFENEFIMGLYSPDWLSVTLHGTPGIPVLLHVLVEQLHCISIRTAQIDRHNWTPHAWCHTPTASDCSSSSREFTKTPLNRFNTKVVGKVIIGPTGL